jgi:hypothetical protein
MAIKYGNSPELYARRPTTAPPRHGHLPAALGDQPGQVSLDEEARTTARDEAEQHQCPACRAPKGQPCTRPPRRWETGRQPFGVLCHAERYALVSR